MISIHISQLIELQKTMPNPAQYGKKTRTVTIRDQHGSPVVAQFQTEYFKDRWAWRPITPMEVLI
jgi:hypothetical protein